MPSWPRAPPGHAKNEFGGDLVFRHTRLYELESNACALALGNRGESEPHPHAASARARRSSEGGSEASDATADVTESGRVAASPDAQQTTATSSPPKASITVSLSRLRLGGQVRSIRRHHRRIEDRNIFLHGECDGFTAPAHFPPTWSRRTHRGPGLAPQESF